RYGCTVVLHRYTLSLDPLSPWYVAARPCHLLFLVQYLQHAGSPALPAADMDGDARADVTRSLEPPQNLLGRAGRRRQIKRHQLIIAGEILLAQTRDVARELGPLRLPPASVD